MRNSRLLHVLLATVPLLLTPAVLFGLAEGILGSDGGEKDVLLVFPWLIWSVVFAVCSYVLIHRRWTVRRWALRAALLSTGVIVALALVAYVVSAAGVA